MKLFEITSLKETPSPRSSHLIKIFHPNEIGAVEKTQASLFIPGDFCRQTDLLNACIQSQKNVYIEKGAFLSPLEMNHVIEKVSSIKNRVSLVDAGIALGIEDRVLDPRSLWMMNQTELPFGINVSELFHYQKSPAQYPIPKWMQSTNFMTCYLKTALNLGAQFITFEKKNGITGDILQLQINKLFMGEV